MFSLSIRAALEAIAEYDDAPWAQFSFYPCPVGAPTPMGCLSDPCPPKEPGCNHADFTECCIKDKFEDCLVHELGCFTNATEAECSFDTRLKLGKFVGCFEGGHVEEDHCPQDPKNCTSAAGLTEHFDAIQACYSNATAVTAAAKYLEDTCAEQNIEFWPHVMVDGAPSGGQGCMEDSCVIPILPHLCKAYTGNPKPKSCSVAGAGEIPTAWLHGHLL
eukprot:gene4205-8290_t